eukprot:13086628-Alexandrium_andersonii.AAC.1
MRHFIHELVAPACRLTSGSAARDNGMRNVPAATLRLVSHVLTPPKPIGSLSQPPPNGHRAVGESAPTERLG